MIRSKILKQKVEVLALIYFLLLISCSEKTNFEQDIFLEGIGGIDSSYFSISKR